MSIKALETHLAPLQPFIEMHGVTEICINQPGEVYVEKDNQFVPYKVAELNYHFLESLALLIAEFNHKDFPAPLLSGSLPSGERVQFVMRPACEKSKLICSIRRHQMRDMKLEDYNANGAFSDVKTNMNHVLTSEDERLMVLYVTKVIFIILSMRQYRPEKIYSSQVEQAQARRLF